MTTVLSGTGQPAACTQTMRKPLLLLLFMSLSVLALGDSPGIVFPDDSDQARGDKQFNLSIPVATSSSAFKVMNLKRFVPFGCEDGSEYCEDSADYPDVDSVKEIVKNIGNPELTKLLFTQRGVADPLQTRNRAPVPITYEHFGNTNSRLNPKIVGTILTESSTATIPNSEPRNPWDDNFITETPLCPTIENYVFPKTAKTRTRQWR